MIKNEFDLKRKGFAFTRKRRALFIILMAGFLSLVAVRNIFMWDYPVIILSVYAVIMAFLCDKEEMLAFAAACIPLAPAFYYDTVLLSFIAVYIIKYPKSILRMKWWALLPLLGMMGIEIAHGAVYGFDFLEFVYSFAPLTFSVFVIAVAEKNIDLSVITRTLAAVTLFCCGVFLLRMLIVKDFDIGELFGNKWFRFGFDMEETIGHIIRYNPNGLGFICNLALAGLLVRMKQMGVNVIDVSVAILLMLFGALTLSRTFILCLAFMLVIFALTVQSGAKKIARNLVIMTILGAVYLLCVWIFAPSIIEYIMARFSDADISNGRVEIMAQYDEYLASSPLHMWFGTGISNTLAGVHSAGFENIVSVPHNGLQQLVVVWGIPGLCLFAILVLLMALRAKGIGGKGLVRFVPLLMWLLKIQAGQAITSGADMTALFVLFAIMSADYSDSGKIKRKNKRIKAEFERLVAR